MPNTYHDNNHIPVLLATSSVDGKTPVLVWADPTTHRLLVTSAASSPITILIPTGAMNQGTFVFTTAPNVIVIDNGATYNQTNLSDGSQNWTGTTTITLNTQYPTTNIFGY